MHDSMIRTLVPYLVGLLLGLAARYGLHIDDATVTPIVTVVVGGAYYAVARWLEEYVHTPLGRRMLALGLTKATPTYHRPR